MRFEIGDELFLSTRNESLILRAMPHGEDRTNADRIRGMNDEELAAWIWKPKTLAPQGSSSWGKPVTSASTRTPALVW